MSVWSHFVQVFTIQKLMSRVNYEVTVVFETDNLPEARYKLQREMLEFLNTQPTVKAVGIIDVEEANKDAALFLSVSKAERRKNNNSLGMNWI